MTDIIDLIIFFGGALSLMLALGQLVKPRRSGRNLLLAILLATAGVIQLQQYYTIAYLQTVIVIGEQPIRFAKFLIGPVIYFYYRLVFVRDSTFHAYYPVHLLPVLLSVALYSLLLLYCPASSQQGPALCEMVKSYRLFFWYHLGGIILLFIYLIYLSIKLGIMAMIINKVRDPGTKIAVMAVIVIVTELILLCISIYSESVFLARAAMMLIAVFIMAWFLISLRNPALNEAIHNEIRKKSYERSRTKNNNTELVARRIIELMEEERTYRDDQLTIQKLANQLKIPNHQLSDIINTSFKSNFNSLINRYRINEAVTMIKENPDCNILSVAYAVGFNSKSAFYDAFTRQTGTTPGQFKSKFVS